MATEPPPPNPYAAPSAALGPEAAAAASAPGSRKPSRLLAMIVTFLAYPLTGSGFHLLRRPRRLAVWMATAVSFYMAMVIGTRLALPWLCVIALAGGWLTMVAALIHTVFTRPGDARMKGRPWLVALALILAGKGSALATRHWLAEAFQMPSGSMVPTLFVGDQLLVKKGRGNVARGDVIVFEFPADRSIEYLKRVVALAGDTVQITDGVVSINGVALEQTEIDGDCPEQEEPGWCQLARETNAGRSYTIIRMPGSRAADQPRTVVPEGQVFVLGDNRDNSSDSRRWGGVPVDAIKGTATVIWFSDTKTGVRWSRIGRGIE